MKFALSGNIDIYIKPKRKVKVKITLQQATKAQRGKRDIALLDGVGVNAALLPHYPREKPSTNCTGGWVSLRARVWTGAEEPAPTGIRRPRHLKIKIVLQYVIYYIVKGNNSKCPSPSTSTKTISFEVTTIVTLIFCFFFLAAFHSQLEG
jgi:hypothetical protein